MLLRTIGTNTHEKQNAPNIIIINCALYNLTDLITCQRYDIIILCAIVKQREECGYEYSCNARRVALVRGICEAMSDTQVTNTHRTPE